VQKIELNMVYFKYFIILVIMLPTMNKQPSTTVQNISTIITRFKNNEIDLNAIYQRDIIWDKHKKGKFIESCIKGIVPNPIIFNNINEKLVCIDGKQRVTSLVEYFDNKFPFEFENDDPEEDKVEYYATTLPKAIKKKNIIIKILDSKDRDRLKNTNIPVVIYENLDYPAEVDIFHRLQNGQVLSQGQIILAASDNVNIATKYKAFFNEKDGIKKKLANLKLCNTDPKYDEHYKFILELIFLSDKTVKQYKKPDKKDIEKLYSKMTVATLTNKLPNISDLILFLNNKKCSDKLKDGTKYLYNHSQPIKYAFMHFMLVCKYKDDYIYKDEVNVIMIKDVLSQVIIAVDDPSYNSKKSSTRSLFDVALAKFIKEEEEEEEDEEEEEEEEENEEDEDEDEVKVVTSKTNIKKVLKKEDTKKVDLKSKKVIKKVTKKNKID
jgi:hypothetical protein